jgi:predicted LPLAT superfamily acyltransferase
LSDPQHLEWMRRPEGGGRFALWLMRTLALRLGRAPARFVLVFVAAYFVLRRGPERRASRAFLARAFGRPATLFEVWKHMFTFATVTLDRIFLLTEAFRGFEIRRYGLEAVERALGMHKGVLFVGGHVGSLEALRAVALERPDARVCPVIDLDQNPGVSALFNALNPQMARTIINSRQDGTSTALAIHEALQQGAIVTVLADRARPGNTLVDVDLLGARASLPTATWLLAASVKVPVVLCFGLYHGGRRYDLHFETFSDGLHVPRADRAHAVQDIVQRFADRMTYYVRLAPYNWFNFYDLWSESDHPR